MNTHAGSRLSLDVAGIVLDTARAARAARASCFSPQEIKVDVYRKQINFSLVCLVPNDSFPALKKSLCSVSDPLIG